MIGNATLLVGNDAAFLAENRVELLVDALTVAILAGLLFSPTWFGNAIIDIHCKRCYYIVFL
jgi:hypothetical protein